MKRWIVDAMNVIGARPDKWWNDPQRAMRRLTATLEAYAERTGDDITVVFDTDPGNLPPHDHLEVVVARRKGRNAADHEIELIVGSDSDPSELCVATSDRRLVEKVRALGAEVVGSGTYRSRLERIPLDTGPD